MIVLNDRKLVHEFFLDRLGLHWSHDFRGAVYVPDMHMGDVMQMDHVAVGVAFNAFIGKTCCMHVVIQKPEHFSRRILRDSFEFAFVECGCEAALALVDSENSEALDLDKRLGFELVHTVPNGGTDGDLQILQMTRANCKWIRAH